MSEVQFNGLKGNYGFYKQDDSKPAEEKAEEKVVVAQENKGVAADKVLDAMQLLGAQNFAQVKNNTTVNPKDHLTDERITSIENSMNVFEKEVQKYADVIKAEFGSTLSEDAIMALAANTFALQA